VYTADITPTADGAVTVDVAADVAADAAANGNTAAAQLSIVYDGTAPTVAITDDDADIVNIADVDVTFTITFSEDVTGFEVGDVAVTGGTKGTFTPVSATEYTLVVTPPADSTTDITVNVAADVAADAAGNGNIAAAQATQTVDTLAPTVPSVPDLNAGSDTGDSNSDNVTNDDTPQLDGTGEIGSTVELTSDVAGSLGTAVVDGSGNWTLTPGAALAEGTHSITAKATDAAGNVSADSGALSLEIDTTDPNAPVITGVAMDTGTADDGVTSDDTLEISGTAEADSMVEVYIGAGSIGTIAADGSGDWMLDHSANALGEGDFVITADATDLAGNTSADSADFDLTVDQTAPTVTDLTPADDATDASTTADLEIVFDETMLIGTGNIVIYKGTDDSVVQTVDVTTLVLSDTIETDDTVAIPHNALSVGVGYYVQVDATCFTDLAGNAFAGIADKVTWNFRSAINIALGNVTGVREFNWVSVPVQIQGPALAALAFSIAYDETQLTFLGDDTADQPDAVRVVAAEVTGNSVLVYQPSPHGEGNPTDLEIDWADDGAGELIVLLHRLDGAAAIADTSDTLTTVLNVVFRVKLNAALTANPPAPLDLELGDVTAIDTMGMEIDVDPGDGTVSIGTNYATVDVDEDGDADVWDANYAYRAAKYSAWLDLIPVVPTEVREIRGNTIMSDEEIHATVMARLDDFDVDGVGGTVVDQDIVYVYRDRAGMPAVPAAHGAKPAVVGNIAAIVASDPDIDAPVMSVSTPMAAAAGVAPGTTTITVRFDESLRLDLVGTMADDDEAAAKACFAVAEDPDGAANLQVIDTVAVDMNSREFILTLVNPLPPAATIGVQLVGGPNQMYDVADISTAIAPLEILRFSTAP